MRVDYKMRFLSGQSVSSAPVIGTRVGTSNESRFFPMAYSGTTAYRTVFGTKELGTQINFNTDYEGSFQPANGVSVINGTSYNISSAGFVKNENNSIYLFATSGYGTELYKSKARIYYVKIYNENGGLVFNGVPVRNASNVCGVYDLTTGTFFGSLTGTAFTCP